MRRLLLPLAAALVLVLGAATFAVAQDASPTAEVGADGPVCPEAAGTPGASPEATPTTGDATGTPAAVTAGSPAASPAAEEGCRVDVEGNAFVPAAIEV